MASGAKRRLFALSAGLALAAVLALGWLTGLRGALHALALLSGAIALLPFLLLTAAVSVVVGASVLGAVVATDTGIFTAGAVDGIATGGSKLVRAYYSLLWPLRRHPLASGAGAGVLLGAVALMAVLWLFVVPREARTLGILLEAQATIDAEHRATGRYPAAAADGYLRVPSPAAGDEPGAAASDGFGRPILYRRDGAWLTASYTLTSLGFDGEPSADDICVTGRTHVRQLMDRLREPMQVLRALRAGTLSFAEQAGALRETRCSRLTQESST
jgi:hypothetical protein